MRSRIAIAVAAFVLAGCSVGTGNEPLYSSTRGVSVTLESIGGACPTNPCAVTIAGDRDTGQTSWETSEGSGRADPDATVELFGFIRDMLADQDSPLDDACSLTDGGERVGVHYTQLPVGPDAHLADAIVLGIDTCRDELPEEFLTRARQLCDVTTAPWPLP